MPVSSARTALPFVFADGIAIAGITEVDVKSNSFFSADRFSVRAALSAAGVDQWSDSSQLIEIQVSVDGQCASLITGTLDAVTMDPIRGELQFSGRDLTSRFVAAQTEESFENQTSSDIASLLANRRGLATAVTPTQTLIGRYYQTSRTRTALPQHARATTEWDLLCWIAQLENFDLWVNGQTLNFQPMDLSSTAFVLSPSDCISLNMHHAMDIASGVTVTVKSWNTLDQTSVTQVASNGVGGMSSVGRTVIRPNLSADEAQMLANRLVSQISGHERAISIELPGDITTAPRMIIELAATGTDFDGQYIICAIERRLSFAHGFTQSIEARSLPWTAF